MSLASHNSPLVSIGVPVYNGERYLHGALDSLLAQDYSNFEIIIADNASTDKTSAIGRAYARRDSRIRYIRRDENDGAWKNFDYVLGLASGKYFMWAAHDDLRAPTYLSCCVRRLEQSPEAVMCFTWFKSIDPDGRVMDVPSWWACDGLDLSSPNVCLRVRNFLFGRASASIAVYGLYRRDRLNTLHLQPAGDVLLMMEVVLLGPCLQVPEYLFFYRRFPDMTLEDQYAKVRAPGARPLPQNVWAFTRAHTHLLRSIMVASGFMRHDSKPAVGWKVRTPPSAFPVASASFIARARLLLEFVLNVYVRPTPWRRNLCGEMEHRFLSALHERRLWYVVTWALPTLAFMAINGHVKSVVVPFIARHYRRWAWRGNALA